MRRLVGRGGGQEVNEKKGAKATEKEEAVASSFGVLSKLSLLLLLLTVVVAFSSSGGQYLPFHPLHRYHSRASRLPALLPGGPALEPGEYLSNCPHPWLFAAGLAKEEGDGRANPHSLWMQEDALLVLYRGWSPNHHGGPVWATHPVDVMTVAGDGKIEKLR